MGCHCLLHNKVYKGLIFSIAVFSPPTLQITGYLFHIPKILSPEKNKIKSMLSSSQRVSFNLDLEEVTGIIFTNIYYVIMNISFAFRSSVISFETHGYLLHQVIKIEENLCKTPSVW